MTESTSRRRPLPVTITRGMPVVAIEDAVPATIVGITQAFGIYRLEDTDILAVARWRELALGNLCPADPLLPPDVTENDRRNARAAVLRELLALRPFGLTPVQQTALEELIAELCQDTAMPPQAT